MVDELTQESFQTGKAIVTVSVDLITAIAEACKRSEEKKSRYECGAEGNSARQGSR